MTRLPTVGHAGNHHTLSRPRREAMSQPASVAQWTTVVRRQLPHLSQPQATVLALWSLGMVLARACGLTAVSLFLATLQERKENTVRQQLREWCYEAPAKRGFQRQALAVAPCFAPLLHWVLAWWQGPQLALALDATNLGTRFVVLAVSVLYRGCAIPVAWTILPATSKRPWKHDWLRLLQDLQDVVPPTMTVLVLTDRGLYARWLFRRIVALGWHPLLRVNAGGYFRPTGRAQGQWLSTYAPQPGTTWPGTGTAFKTQPVACTLLACWPADQRQPWLLVTDLSPAASVAAWYGLRTWIEQGFRLIKRGGWQWQQTRMTDPDRAARLWLAVAVATLWLVSVGGLAEDAIPVSTVLDVTDALGPHRATRRRVVSVFRRGWVTILVALLQQAPLPLGRLLPEPWPCPQPQFASGRHHDV
ncbi:MAG: endonuclease [Dehalococcoidia bacterium]|nr:endonuclease [Dehalococcoidia bacterium]